MGKVQKRKQLNARINNQIVKNNRASASSTSACQSEDKVPLLKEESPHKIQMNIVLEDSV